MQTYTIFIVASRHDQQFFESLLAPVFLLQCYRDLPCALRAARKNAPYILFLAAAELHRRGLSALGRCKKHLPQTKIIVLADNDADFLGQAALAAGADEVLFKPIGKEKVQQLLGVPSLA
jgi:DNA-binding NarL/FixJ family response regulator